MLAASGISKRFGRTIALAEVDFRAYPGEIHALVGENGAGKSTLINIFTGRSRPDSGVVTLDGLAAGAGSASAALRSGIVAVYQSPMLFERLSWEENLGFGGFCPAGRFDLQRVADSAARLAGELGFALPPPGTTIEQRSVTERVRLEILRALSFNPRVLILDEPTGVLAAGELAPFLEVLRRLRGEGRIVVIVTHKLSEALAVADRVTVLRHGRVIAERLASATSESELAKWMIGEIPPRADKGTSLDEPGEPVLSIESVTLRREGRTVLDGLSLTLARGAISGIAGVDGNGQDELVELLAGVHAPASGRIRFHDGSPATNASLTVIPQNRDLDGLILDFSLWENLLLSRALRRRFGGRYGGLRRAPATDFCRGVLGRFGVRSAGPRALAASLSGGNRQRFAVARALAARPRAIVAHDICRGLDLGAATELHTRLRQYAAGGGAVLLISSDLDELLELCDRLYVINRGRLSEIPVESRTTEEIGLLMSGATR
ncbi:MAG TPA: ATP-binding cassette domain-containing protein [Candidatus Binataceae bacterium]|nr:ATP-binding cassette domain-containing protein [Candidatus Binataceae bacterium]